MVAIIYILFSFLYYNLYLTCMKRVNDEVTKVVISYVFIVLSIPTLILILLFGKVIFED